MRLPPALLTRRAMLRHTAEAAAFGLGCSAFAPLLAAATSRGFKIGGCDWSLGKRGDPAALDVAKQIGLDGVQIDFGTVGNNMRLRTPEHQRAYREAMRRTGLVVSSMALCEMNEVPLKSDPRAATWLDQSINVCHTMGLPLVMTASFGRGDLDMSHTAEIDHFVQVLRDVAPKAEKLGIIIGLENYLSAGDNRKIIDRVASPQVKVYYDVGNSTDKGRDVAQEIRGAGQTDLRISCQGRAVHARQGTHRFPQSPPRNGRRGVQRLASTGSRAAPRADSRLYGRRQVSEEYFSDEGLDSCRERPPRRSVKRTIRFHTERHGGRSLQS